MANTKLALKCAQGKTKKSTKKISGVDGVQVHEVGTVSDGFNEIMFEVMYNPQ